MNSRHHTCKIMDNLHISRSYLESLSSSDLMALADEYGIDIPENLNRRFIIAEILEAVEDANEIKQPDLVADETAYPQTFELPKSYNETQISVILRNPVWCFVYWDIRAADMQMLTPSHSFSELNIRVCFFPSKECDKPSESFEIPVTLENREQYVHIPASEHIIRLDLIASFTNREPQVLASSKKLTIPKGCPEISCASLQREMPPILALSGMNDLLRNQYKDHRQSFS